ncbi:hypothetical protein M422DRAFT_260216 [Sphaerobolus stellatus SS14]|uniref:Hydrophobic surface binding protein A n=1 Tax=Sphaerobolus stellatus (strain SS14) TaxID=990650 RepID=A0A0C9UR76_SPHS4|nr:hypothetical protein M422DRAFT_260216 [Sphaerobolus stellatus SS14]
MGQDPYESSLTSTTTSTWRRTVAQVKTDIATITTDVNNLNTAITAFTAGNLAAALNIHTVSTTLDTAIKQGTIDVLANGAFSETDAAAILALIQQLQPNILTALTNIATKKSLFDALPITGLGSVAKADIKTLSTDTSADIKPNATTVANTINAAFTTAIAAYASEA